MANPSNKLILQAPSDISMLTLIVNVIISLIREPYFAMICKIISFSVFGFTHLLNWSTWRSHKKEQKMGMKVSAPSSNEFTNYSQMITTTKDSGRSALPLFTKKSTYQDEVNNDFRSFSLMKIKEIDNFFVNNRIFLHPLV